MAKDGRWTSGSLGFCMKTECLNHGSSVCDICIRWSDYKTAIQLELPFGQEGDKK